MTTWTTISNALVAVGAKPFATTIQALRDNVAAGLEGAANSPITAAGWHPYNKVLNGGTEDGKFYDFAVNGAVSFVETPNWVDGYEYRVRYVDISTTSGATVNFRVYLWRETDGTYGPPYTLQSSLSGVNVHSGVIEFLNVRKAQRTVWTPFWGTDSTSASASGVITASVGFDRGTAQKRLRAYFEWSGGSIDGGQMFLDRRLAVY